MDFFLKSGTSVDNLVESVHAIVELVVQEFVLEKYGVLFRNLKVVFLIWQLRDF